MPSPESWKTGRRIGNTETTPGAHPGDWVGNCTWPSWLYLPWVVKMFWGPVVDTYSTKRNWILATQVIMACCMFVITSSLRLQGYFAPSLIAFVTAAFVSATYDIATDGFYMLALTEKEQAFFVGLRSGFYRLAMIFGSGLLVYLAGWYEATGDIPRSWILVLSFSGGILHHRSRVSSLCAALSGSR